MKPKKLFFLKKGRSPQLPDKRLFQETWPLVLENHVSPRNTRAPERPCMKETLAFLSCLGKNNHSDVACKVEAQIMQKCYMDNLKEIKEKKKTAGTDRDFFPEKKELRNYELNRFLKHFPHKLKN